LRSGTFVAAPATGASVAPAEAGMPVLIGQPRGFWTWSDGLAGGHSGTTPVESPTGPTSKPEFGGYGGISGSRSTGTGQP
jgi:hypothetical protein